MSYTQTSGTISPWAIEFLQRGDYDHDLDYICFVDDDYTYIVIGDLIRSAPGSSAPYDSIYSITKGATIYSVDNSTGRVDVTTYQGSSSTQVFIVGDAKTFSSMTPDARQIVQYTQNTDYPLLFAFVTFALTFFILYAWRSFVYKRGYKNVK